MRAERTRGSAERKSLMYRLYLSRQRLVSCGEPAPSGIIMRGRATCERASGPRRPAKREVAPGLDHWSHKGLNNRAENSHLPFRKREWVMHGFRSPGGLQRFVSMQSATRNRFSVPARRRSALTIGSKHSRRGNPRHMPLDQRPECNLQTRRVNVTTPIFSVCIDTA